MSSSEIHIDQALNHLGQGFKELQSLSRKQHTGQGGAVQKEQRTAGAKAQGSHTTFRHFQAVNAKLNQTAMSVRTDDQIMDTIGKFIAEMKAQLERIIKNFPPFPPGSEERAKILRSYNALRKQIEQIAFPTRLPGVRKFMEDQKIVFKTSDAIAQSVGRWIRQTKGLDLPELSEMSTDQEITDAILLLHKAGETLKQNREMAAREASGIFSTEGAKWIGLDGDVEPVESQLSEEAAESKSRELQQMLSAGTIKSGIHSQSSIFDYIDESE
jgi:hypothetical protein